MRNSMQINMPKREYGKWSSEDMKNAIKEYENGNIGFNACCRKYEIPKPTFKRHLLKQVKRGEKVSLSSKRRVNGRQPALPEEMEQELVSHILKFEELLFGLTIRDEVAIPSTSGLTQQEKIRLNKQSKTVSIEQISPLPKVCKKMGERAQKGAQKVAVLTESPYKNALEEKYAIKAKKEDRKRAKEISKKGIFQEEKSKQKTKTTKPSKKNEVLIEINADEWFCVICQEGIIEDMIQCTKCGEWAHEMCADLTRPKSDYVCDLCFSI
ncbi:unnamed protein product [Brassicogethes aeneus]|uniref:Zinc finger PHD-type domain-containing protein n=1 Tax=Brassicogethes aeneus TaxID=1431903 RepID=A0A9P0B9Y2_BRAAE|nr:unnamed protein product [Brassicogethes aeneus]